MMQVSRVICGLLVPSVILAGCADSGDRNSPAAASEPPKRAPRVATMYVDSTGEPLGAGGKKVEKADGSGAPTGEFSAKDLLMPGMFVLVSGATALGGPLLIRALDKKDRPSGRTYLSSGGDDGTYVPVETSGDGTPSDTGAGPRPGATGRSPDSPTPDPGKVLATARDGMDPSSKAIATGRGVVSTPSSILLSMGYATDFSGPSYISGSAGSSGALKLKSTEIYVYRWTLTVGKPTAGRGEEVDVFIRISGLPADALVCLYLEIIGNAVFRCDRSPLLRRYPKDGIRDEWVFRCLTGSSYGNEALAVDGKIIYSLIFRLKVPDAPFKIGTLSVQGDTEIVGESTAEVTVH